MEESFDSPDLFEKMEENGKANILRYFDRIHDKLFDYNNFMIAGYFALTTITNSIPTYYILAPVANMMVLIFIEYRMMEISRTEAKITYIT